MRNVCASIGKLEIDIDQMIAAIEFSGFKELPVRAVHAAGMRNLPDFHRDPFDRLLLAQALFEPLRLVTSDGHLSKYSDLVISV